MEGKNLFAEPHHTHFGTRDNPAVVTSYFKYRIIGCSGRSKKENRKRKEKKINADLWQNNNNNNHKS